MAEYRVEEGEIRDDVVLLNGDSLLVSVGTVNGAVVSEGGLLDLNGGTVNGAAVFGSMFISGGFASGTVLSGGSRVVTGGGTAQTLAYFSGSVAVFRGGTVSATTVRGGNLALSGGEAYDTVMTGGHFHVYDGAAEGVALSGGDLAVHNGGSVNNAAVQSGGQLIVSGGGTATAVTENGGYVRCDDGAQITFLPNTISGLELTGLATLHEGTTASGASIEAGGCLFVYGGGVADDATVRTGGLVTVEDGGKLTGRMTFENGAYVTMSSDAILNFDLSRASADAALVNDLSVIQGMPKYTLTVDGDLTPGTYDYKLADGAAEFNSTISVVNTAGDELGTLMLGETVTLSGIDYTLSLIESTLSVSLTKPDPVISSGLVLKDETRTVGPNEQYIDTTLSSGGSLYVTSDGSANFTTVNYYGDLIVSSGGAATSTTVNTYGNFTVSSGGTANNTTVNTGGKLTVSSGGRATIVFNPWQGSIVSSSGASINYLERDANIYYGKYGLFSKADVLDSLTLSGLSAIVYSGGTADKVILDRATLVCNGGTAKTTLNSGGVIVISSGGIANSTTLKCSLSSYDVKNASMFVYEGGVANYTRVTGLYDPITGYNFSGGILTVSRGGAVNYTTIDSGGFLHIHGGVANDTTINGCGMERYVSIDVKDILFASMTLTGGIANSTTVNTGGHFIITGGTATRIIENGGYVEVRGGKVSFASNTFSRLVLSSFESATLHSGTTAVSVSILSNAGLMIYSGGKLTGRTVVSGGIISAFDGAVVDFDLTEISPSSAARINDLSCITGATPLYTITVTAGQTEGIYMLAEKASGFDSAITVVNSVGESLGTLEVGSTITVSDVEYTLLLSDETLTLTIGNENTAPSSPYTSDGMIVSSGKSYVKKDAVFHDTLVFSSGALVVSSGGLTDSTTVFIGGSLCIENGGSATNIIENGGYVEVAEGADVSFMPNVFSNCYLESGKCTLHSGTTAYKTLLAGSLFIYDGGVASGVDYFIPSRDDYREFFIAVSSGGIVNDAELVKWRCSMFVYEGGTANRTALIYSGIEGNGRGGQMTVFSNAVANSTIVGAGGRVILSGGTANNAFVKSGGNMLVSSGGKLTGRMTFENGVNISMYKETILDFDLTQAEAGAEEALVNDLSVIQGTPLYTLTVDGDLRPGTHDYKLAEGAAEFNSTISVVNKAGDELGTLAVGETLKVGEIDYTLNLTESTLSITVEVPIPPPPDNPVGDKDGVSWDSSGAGTYVVEYSTDHFEHVIRTTVNTNKVDSLELPAGTYQWRVKADGGEEWAVGADIVSDNETSTAKALRSNEDGNSDIFFVTPNGTWGEAGYFSVALHYGSVNDWTGTREIVDAEGKSRIHDLFFGSSDPNVLCLTDAENGDAIFVDDVYTGLPEEIAEHTARLYRIQEIRAGAGDDIVDMTSQRFEYVGDGLTIRGGNGDDTIWANKGDNWLFGDAGKDRIVGASGNDVIAGGSGNDRLHGGGGNDVFTFCDNWGVDTVEQLETGTVTLWFASGSLANWNAQSLTYRDGQNRVRVIGVSAEQVTLKFGGDGDDAAQFAALSNAGAFDAFTSQRIFEENNSGILAGQ